MSKIRITKEFKFEMAHALEGYDGDCKHIHGHSYELWVTVKGEPIKETNNPKNGMVMDFGELKKIVRNEIIDLFDHSLVLKRNPNHELLLKTQDLFDKLVLVDYQPTSENMLIDFAERLKKSLPKNITLFSLKLRETVTSYAEWFAEDNI